MTIEIYNDSSAYVGKVDNGYIYQSSSSILGDDQVGFVEDWRVYSTEESRDQVAVVENNGYIDRVGSGTTSERIGGLTRTTKSPTPTTTHTVISREGVPKKK